MSYRTVTGTAVLTFTNWLTISQIHARSWYIPKPFASTVFFSISDWVIARVRRWRWRNERCPGRRDPERTVAPFLEHAVPGTPWAAACPKTSQAIDSPPEIRTKVTYAACTSTVQAS